MTTTISRPKITYDLNFKEFKEQRRHNKPSGGRSFFVRASTPHLLQMKAFIPRSKRLLGRGSRVGGITRLFRRCRSRAMPSRSHQVGSDPKPHSRSRHWSRDTSRRPVSKQRQSSACRPSKWILTPSARKDTTSSTDRLSCRPCIGSTLLFAHWIPPTSTIPNKLDAFHLCRLLAFLLCRKSPPPRSIQV